MSKIIGIVGSRRRVKREDYLAVKKVFDELYQVGDEIVSGGCPTGADSWAEFIAKRWQIPIQIYYAPWNRVGKTAGFSRNTLIAMKATVLIACVAKDRTGGTEDTITKFKIMPGKQGVYLV